MSDTDEYMRMLGYPPVILVDRKPECGVVEQICEKGEMMYVIKNKNVISADLLSVGQAKILPIKILTMNEWLRFHMIIGEPVEGPMLIPVYIGNDDDKVLLCELIIVNSLFDERSDICETGEIKRKIDEWLKARNENKNSWRNGIS